MGRRHRRDDGGGRGRRRSRASSSSGRSSSGGAAGGGGRGQLVREHWRSDGTAKVSFRSPDDAARASLQARLEHGTDVDPYHCSVCGAWHLGRRD